VPAHKGFQAALLLFIRQLAEQHQPHHVQEWHRDKVIDVDAAVAEQADVALHIGDGGLPDDDTGEVVGEYGFL
jgi:hypothetical protein